MSLLYIDSSDFLPMSQYIFLAVSSSCFLLVLICLAHVSLLSRCIPRYLTTSAVGSGCPYSFTCGQFPFLVANVMWTDFVSLAFVLHRSSHSCVAFSWTCSAFDAATGSVSAARIAVSYAIRFLAVRRILLYEVVRVLVLAVLGISSR